MPRAFRLLPIALCLLLCVILRAQSPSPIETESPAATLKLNVRTVLVDVVVTDRDNRAVAGLKKEDFQVLEDGKPQTVSFFDANFAPDPSAAAAQAPHLPPNFFTNVPAFVPSNSVNVLLMDGLNTQLTDQAVVHRQMVKYLASIPPGIRIGVFMLGERLRIIQGFTQDSAVLRASIARFAANPSTSALLPTSASIAAQDAPVNMELQISLAEGSTQIADMAAGLQQFNDSQNFFETNERTVMTLDALQQIGRYLAGVPGRKNLIWFVGAIPQCLAAMTSENELTAAGCPYQEKYDKTMALLADARVSVYPIDAGGTPTDSLYDAAGPPASADLGVSGAVVTPPNTATQPSNSAVQQINAAQAGSLLTDYQAHALAHMEMDQIAKLTGGSAVYERNSLKDALEKAVDNGSRYYTIAYTPTNRREIGKERKIEIRTASGDYKLSYRRSYFEDTPKERKAEEMAVGVDPLRPLMDRGMPNFTELRYRLRIAPADPQPVSEAARAGDNSALKTPTTRYTVNFWLAPDGLTLIPGQDGVKHGTIEVALVAYSQDGKPLNWQARSIGLSIRPEQEAAAQASGIPFHFEIDAPPGDVYLRTGICDSSSSKAGTLEIPLRAVMVAQK
ncbi:MAG: VWA domain-containing protein [Terracidiphilus sp.]